MNSESPLHPQGHRCTTVLCFILMYTIPGSNSLLSDGIYSTNCGVTDPSRLLMVVPAFSAGRCSRSGTGQASPSLLLHTGLCAAAIFPLPTLHSTLPDPPVAMHGNLVLPLLQRSEYLSAIVLALPPRKRPGSFLVLAPLVVQFHADIYKCYFIFWFQRLTTIARKRLVGCPGTATTEPSKFFRLPRPGENSDLAGLR